MNWRLHPAREFSAIAPAWDVLNDACGGIPFLGSAVIDAALAHFGTGNELVAVCEEDGRMTRALILKRAGMAGWQTFQPSQLPLGPVLLTPDARLTDASMQALFRVLPGLPLTIGLTQLDPIMVARPEESAAFSSLDYIRTAWVEVAGEFDAYWANRGKNLRDNVKKLGKKVAAEGLSARLEQVTDPAQMAAAVEDYAMLETAGWKRSVGTAVSTETAQGRFYVDMMQRMARLNRARAYRYWFGDAVVTMDLCVEHGDVMVVLKTAYDERFGKFSPATLMREQISRQIFAEGRIRRIEFYGPVMDWHTRWTEHSRTLYHANLFRSSAIRRMVEFARAGLRRRSVAEDHAVAVDEK